MLLTEYNETETMQLFKEEGRAEGRIFESVDIYRNELNMDNDSIIAAIRKKFNLSLEKAKEYVLSPVNG